MEGSWGRVKLQLDLSEGTGDWFLLEGGVDWLAATMTRRFAGEPEQARRGGSWGVLGGPRALSGHSNAVLPVWQCPVTPSLSP